MKDHSFGPHIMLDLNKCSKEKLTDIEALRQLLLELPEKLGMTRISEPELMFHKDKWAETAGVTGVVMISESHISLHTFPDSEFVFVDIFSCRHFDTDAAQKHVVDWFGAQSVKVKVVERGEEFEGREEG
jgi:S-adenosylmethionine decarboxylase